MNAAAMAVVMLLVRRFDAAAALVSAGRPPARANRSGSVRRARTAAFVAAIGLALLILIVRLVQIQVIDGDRYRAAAQANQVRLIPVAAPRGIIFDRHGGVLARSRPSFVVALIPSEMTDPESRAGDACRGILEIPAATLQKRLLHHRGLNYRNFAEVAAYEPYGPVLLAADLPVAKVARLSEFLSDLPGVDLETQPIREYPEGAGASHLDRIRRIRSPRTSTPRSNTKAIRPTT